MYSIGMVTFGLRDVLGRVFYSLQDTKRSMIDGAIAMIMNIVFNLIFIRYFKHAGLALGTSLSGIICVILLFNSLRKKLDYFKIEKVMITITKVLISSIVMGVVVYFINKFMLGLLGIRFINDVIDLIVSVIFGICVYSGLVILLKAYEIRKILNFIKKK